MKIGFTGTQIGMTAVQSKAVKNTLVLMKGKEFHHGDCVGADAEAHVIAVDMGIEVTVHPPENSSRRAWCRGSIMHDPAPYIARNHAIVDSVETLIAAPDGEVERMRSGTWATIRYARKMKIPVTIIGPRGDEI